MYKAIVWDLDGTLLDTLQDLAASTNAALKVQGYPPRRLEEIRAFVGNGVEKLLRRALPGPVEEADFAALFSSFRAHYAQHCNDNTAPYPGILRVLKILRARGIPMAVVSNKLDSAVKELCRHYFEGCISVAIGDRPGLARKPAPDGVALALRELGVSAEEALYIGDSEVDVLTARAAGLPLLCVSWGFRSEAELRRAGAGLIAPDVEALMALLEGRMEA